MVYVALITLITNNNNVRIGYNRIHLLSECGKPQIL